MATVTDWTIEGAEGEAIIGNTHVPDGEPAGVVLIAHGFKGYKDYGMFPAIAAACCAGGLIAHRFNFSHSGMTNDIETFQRPNLFERDTWNKQVHDYRAVIDAVAGGTLAGSGLPYVMFGHSRGGVTTLLAAGRYADDATMPQPSGVITAATPSRCNSLTQEEMNELLEKGSIESPSSRTGQALRVGRAFLQEQLDEPMLHDLLEIAAHVRCAALIIHGEDDPTVPVDCVYELGRALGERRNELIIDGGDHVFNTPNPFPPDAEPSKQLVRLLEGVVNFARSVCAIAQE